jgi:hypothetical protein
MSKLTRFISLLGIAVFVLSACTNQVPSPHQTTVSTPTATVLAPHMALLKLAGTVPASCPITPVFTGPSGGSPNLDFLPWMKAEPTSSGIVAYLFFVLPGFATTHTYRPLHTGGGYPDGSTTKILWSINNPNASVALEIIGKKRSAGHETFQQTFPMASSPRGDYPSIVNVPTPGCWQLQIKSGTVAATVTFWVVGN